MATTFHLVPAAYFESTDEREPYVPEAFEQDGFIHCTDGIDHVVQTANRYYKDDLRGYLVLVIDTTKVRARIVYEDPDRIYPHLYGPLNRDAILATLPVPRAADGSFLAPSHAPQR
ncbi:MAG: DUF952 domain-containing protein [Dehalococcoidia bacterium]